MKLDDFLGQKTASRCKIWKGQCCWGILLCHSLSIGTVSPYSDGIEDGENRLMMRDLKCSFPVIHWSWKSPESHLYQALPPRPPPTRSKPASHSTVQPQSWDSKFQRAERDWTSQIMFWRYRIALLPRRGVVNIGQLRELQHEVDSTVHK